MTIQQIIDAANSMINKEQAGYVLKPSRVTSIMNVLSNKYFTDEYAHLMDTIRSQGMKIEELLRLDHPLNVFIKEEDISSDLVVGTDYVWGLACYSQVAKDGTIKPVELVDRKRFESVRTGLIRRNPSYNPYAVVYLDGSEFKVETLPSDITSLKMWYIRKPSEPFYDYCIKTSSDNIIYMPVDSVIKSDGHLYDSSDNVLEQDVEHPTATVFPYTSQTTELEWNDNYHQKFVFGLVEWAATNMRDVVPLQVAGKENSDSSVTNTK